ncbi:MAG TPA: hypothetical protein VFV99_02070, partial [Kofleriaceae bacterium]|nr:hypothetical protein [Kofleriaceae bacterium]
MPKPPPTPAGKLLELAVTPSYSPRVDGRTLCIPDGNSQNRRFDIDTGKALAPLPFDRTLWLGTGRDRSVRKITDVLDVVDSKGNVICSYKGIGYAHVTPSPDGSMIAIHRVKEPLRIASATDNQLVEIPDGKIKQSCEVAWSPDGSYVVVYSHTEAIVIDIKARKATTRLKLRHVTRCLFVPNHNVFLAGDYKRITIWDP